MAITDPLTSWATSQANILKNVAASLLPVEKLITGAAYLMGIGFAFKAIYALKAYGESRAMMSSSGSLKEPLIYLFVAAMFIYFPTGLDLMLATTFGETGLLAYQTTDNNTYDALASSLTLIIQVIGLVAFVRGWVLIARAASQGQQPGGTGKGLVHVFGGILAMNIIATLKIIHNTLYGVG
jgi:intracellular multiplication protein IcmC